MDGVRRVEISELRRGTALIWEDYSLGEHIVAEIKLIGLKFPILSIYWIEIVRVIEQKNSHYQVGQHTSTFSRHLYVPVVERVIIRAYHSENDVKGKPKLSVRVTTKKEFNKKVNENSKLYLTFETQAHLFLTQKTARY